MGRKAPEAVTVQSGSVDRRRERNGVQLRRDSKKRSGREGGDEEDEVEEGKVEENEIRGEKDRRKPCNN